MVSALTLLNAYLSSVALSEALQFASYKVQELPNCSRNVWWLHVPKAGVSFGHSAELCNRLHVNTGDSTHDPLPINISEEDLSSVVAMFRQPDQRLASSFAYMRWKGHAPIRWGFQSYRGETEDVYRLIQQGQTPATNASMAQNFSGCQTNMLIGRRCMLGASHQAITRADMNLAKRRADKLFFVGLHEKWALSICLFNYLATGRRFVSQLQLAVCNPTPGKTQSTYDTRRYPRDRADEEIYAYVSRRFERDLHQHNITEHSCGQKEDGGTLDMLVQW